MGAETQLLVRMRVITSKFLIRYFLFTKFKV